MYGKIAKKYHVYAVDCYGHGGSLHDAARYREKHPDRNRKVLFCPKAALSGFKGMNRYDPLFGEAFDTDSFHSGIPHEELLKNIK